MEQTVWVSPASQPTWQNTSICVPLLLQPQPRALTAQGAHCPTLLAGLSLLRMSPSFLFLLLFLV